MLGTVSNITKALGKGGLEGALVGVGLAAAGMAVAIGVEAVNKASAFQNAMLQNVAHAGLAKDQFDAVSQSVLNMSTDVGQMPTDLAKGLYPILSGFSGISNESAKAKTSLEALRLAAEDVVGTETKTTVTSGALVSAFNALGLQTNDTATNIARLKTLNDQMEATVIAGNMHWDQYANVVGKLATAIKGTNVQWTEASAALATMTNEGFTAQRSQTYLANLFTQLDLKTDSLNKNAKKLNITFDEQKFKSMSLIDQLNYLKNITGDNSSEVLKLLNNNATALKTYNALESGMKSYKVNLDAIKNSQGATATAFDTASSSFKAAKDRMAAAINVLLIDLGTQLLPVLSKVLDWVAPLIKQLANWVTTSQDLHVWISKVSSILQYNLVPWLTNTWNAASQVVQWFQRGGPAVDLVTGAALSLGIAIASVKVAGLVGDFASFVASVPNIVGKFFLIQQSAEAAAGAKGIAALGTAATDAEAAVATAATGMGLSVGGIVAIAAAVLVAGGLEVKYAVDQYNKNLAAGYGVTAHDDMSRFSGVNRSSAIHDALKQAAQDAIYWDDQIKLAWQDMATLTDSYQKNGRILGTLSGITNDFSTHLSAADQHAVYLKSDLDKVDTHYEPHIITTQIEKAMNEARVTRLRLDDLASPVSIQVGTRSVDAAIEKVMYAKSKLDDLGGPSGTGYIPGHASGITNSPSGHMAIVGERGPEMMYVPRGASIAPNGTSFGGGHTFNIYVSTLAGSRSEIIRMVDLLEAEIAARFRGQTSYGFGGVV